MPDEPAVAPMSPPCDTILPLVVDLDGTLSRVDTLHESFLKCLLVNPVATSFAVLHTLPQGKAELKEALATIAIPDPALLPYRAEVLDKIRQHRQADGKVILATGAHRSIAEGVAAHLGCFDAVYSTEDGRNLVGAAKRDLLASRFGGNGFDYIGDSNTDIPVWKAAREGWVVGSLAKTTSLAERSNLPLRRLEPFPDGRKPAWTILRPHQWVKNLLVALPVFASHKFLDPHLAWLAFLIFLAFCCCASLVYLGNDLVDRESDRKHPSKSRRPIAAGTLSIPRALLLLLVCTFATLALTSFLPWQATVGLAAYLVANVAYSIALKKRLLVDVFLLASMYVWRIAVGALATGIDLSGWLFETPRVSRRVPDLSHAFVADPMFA